MPTRNIPVSHALGVGGTRQTTVMNTKPSIRYTVPNYEVRAAEARALAAAAHNLDTRALLHRMAGLWTRLALRSCKERAAA